MKATLEIRYRRIRVLTPIGKQKRYPELTLTAIYAQERGTPKDREPIDWKLLTDLPVSSRTQALEKLVWYRNRLTHGLMPSVDYPELYTFLEDRVGQPIVDATGKEIGRNWGIGARPTKAEYAFLDLYDWVVKTLEHSVAMLRRLQALPRFNP